MLVGSLQLTDLLQMANYPRTATDTYILKKWTLNVSTNRPYSSSNRDFHLLVVGSAQMKDSSQIVTYLRPAIYTLPSEACQSLSS